MKQKSLFDHVNAVFTSKNLKYYETLNDVDKKTWSDYMINRFISMNMNFVPIVNEVQMFYNQIKGKELFKVYADILPRGKQYNKYIKGAKDETNYESWVVEIVASHYMVGTDEAQEYLNIFYATPTGKSNLKQLLESYGTDAKKIKKLKL